MTLEELKALQLTIIKKNKTINKIFIVIAVVLIAAVCFYQKYTHNGESLSLLPLIAGPAIIVLAAQAIVKYFALSKSKRLFKKEFKQILVQGALKKVFDEVNYEPNRGISSIDVASTNMMTTGDRFSSEDYISAKYHGINLQQSDVKIEIEHRVRDSNGRERVEWETIFLGRWMIFDFNKQFKSDLQVASSHFRGKISYGKKVKLEDVEFNKRFATYAESELEAFYILTPHFMERIKNIKEKLHCDVMFCFVNSKLHVAVNNKSDSFEHNVLKEINEAEVQDKIMKDIKVITDFVDDLNLDNNLFKKEV